jgi:hypothetical protein
MVVWLFKYRGEYYSFNILVHFYHVVLRLYCYGVNVGVNPVSFILWFNCNCRVTVTILGVHGRW